MITIRFQRRWFAGGVALSIGLAAPFDVRGQTGSRSGAQEAGHSHAGDHADHNHGGEALAYRLLEGKTLEFTDPRIAAQHLAAVQQLGCVAKQESHDGHTDVVYRCKDWRVMTLANHALAEQWEGWLKGAGFDVSHGHVAAQLQQGAESIELRLLEWKTIHAEGPQVAQLPPLLQRLNAIGCEVVQDVHDGHADVRYRCPIWTEIHVPDHATAEQWLAWLKAQGFESKHED